MARGRRCRDWGRQCVGGWRRRAAYCAGASAPRRSSTCAGTAWRCCRSTNCDTMLRDLKFGGALTHGRVLGTLLGQQRVALDRPCPGVVIPMPLHPARHSARGFNQARELATAASRVVGARLGTDLLIRIRNTRPQSSLDSASRRDNMQSAFVCPRPLPVATVALVDDVMTTGATAAAAAAALRAAGARSVELWVVARVVREA
jgi:ComF family protein